MIDLEAIRARNRKRMQEHVDAAGGTTFLLREPLPENDIYALLDEVEWLRAHVEPWVLEEYDLRQRVLACPHSRRDTFREYAFGPDAPRRPYCLDCHAVLSEAGEPVPYLDAFELHRPRVRS